MNLINRWRNLISDGETEDVLNQLENKLSSSTLINEIIILKYNYSTLNKRYSQNLVTDAVSSVEQNRLVLSILDFLKENEEVILKYLDIELNDDLQAVLESLQSILNEINTNVDDFEKHMLVLSDVLSVSIPAIKRIDMADLEASNFQFIAIFNKFKRRLERSSQKLEEVFDKNTVLYEKFKLTIDKLLYVLDFPSEKYNAKELEKLQRISGFLERIINVDPCFRLMELKQLLTSKREKAIHWLSFLIHVFSKSKRLSIVISLEELKPVMLQFFKNGSEKHPIKIYNLDELKLIQGEIDFSLKEIRQQTLR